MLASGITAIAGFGVLIFSNITMLRDFGFVTLIDLSVSLVGVLLLLPAVLALSERDDLLEAARGIGAPGDRGGAAAGPARPGRVSESEESAGEVRKHRLDPDRAAASAATTSPAPEPPEATPDLPRHQAVPVDHRHHRADARGRLLGAAVRLARRRDAPACRPVRRLHFFAAPLAASTLNGAANLSPPCTLARHDPRALNICLLAKRGAARAGVLRDGLERAASARSTRCRRSPGSSRRDQVQFAAVAVGAGHAKIAGEVRSHHWTIPVAYDSDGRVGRSVRRQRLPAGRARQARRRGVAAADRQPLAQPRATWRRGCARSSISREPVSEAR